jgi:hypothetical protein
MELFQEKPSNYHDYVNDSIVTEDYLPSFVAFLDASNYLNLALNFIFPASKILVASK